LSASINLKERREPSEIGHKGVPEARHASWQANGASQFEGEALLQLPTDYPRKVFQTFRPATQPLMMGKRLSEAIETLSQQEGVTLFATLLASLDVLLYRYTDQEDIVIGSSCTVQKWSGTEQRIGVSGDSAVLSTNVSGNPSFRELTTRVQEVTLTGGLPPRVCPNLPTREPEPVQHRGLRTSPKLFFSLRSERTDDASDCAVTDNDGFDFHVELTDAAEGICGQFSYNADLFDAETIVRMIEHWRTLVESAVTDPGRKISDLPLLGKTERERLLFEWNDTKVDYRAVCLHQLIEEQVERTPDNVAVIFEDQQLTYRELNARANQLGHYLQRMGVGAEVLVGICIERSLGMMVGLLGILKAGGAYVPLDPQYPSDRLSLMLQDSGLKVLVTQGSLRPKLSEYKGQLVCLDLDTIGQESGENCAGKVKPENLAYVIYTSGSTGKPKGVQICHRSLANFLISMQSRPGLTAEDTLLAVTTVSFDIAALELYLPLTVGARLVLVSREAAADGYQLREALEGIAPTVMQATPATWRLLLEAGWRGSTDLKLQCGGEAMPRELAAELLKRASEVWNMYGPTETTVWSTTSRVTSSDGPITVGRPIANTEIYILDSHLEPVPVGVPGELYIGGDGVARGYLHRPDLTTEKFIPNLFREREPGARMYRTGDLTRYRANGEIECLGRIDHQVKVRGFRIELGEIESVLGQHPSVGQNVVIAREDVPGDKRLVAYVAASQGQSITVEALRDFLIQKLPDYMVPSRFVFLEALPLTPNGKVDRRALPAPPQLELAKQKEYVAARDAVETRLVKIWESVLSIRPLGVKQNFFELGGHSLLVAKLLRRIEQAFGKKLSMAAIFQAPTVEQQGAMLRNRSTLPQLSAVVSIQPAGSKPPFFCFGFDTGPVFLPLARRLGSDQPLLCVGLTLLEASQLPTPYKMEDIAACMVKEVREIQPAGPYYLGGLCVGGLMAYEAARQIMAQGQEVALLALFEPQTPVHFEARSKAFRLDLLGQRLRFHFRNLQLLEIREAPPYIRDRARTLKARVRRLAWHTVYDLQGRVNDRRLQNLGDIQHVAGRAYQPQPYTGRVALFQATNRPVGRDWDQQFGWRKLAARLEVHEIPGHHESFFLEPNVEGLADKLSRCLDEAQAGAEGQEDEDHETCRSEHSRIDVHP
jgi:amino acid adenylation domain-containing protein